MLMFQFHYNFINQAILRQRHQIALFFHLKIGLSKLQKSILQSYIVMHYQKVIISYCFLFTVLRATFLEIYPDFEQFKLQFNKNYQDKTEEEFRKSVYYNNLNKIQELNNQFDFQAGVTKFTDRTQQEIKSMKNERITPPMKSVTSHYTINRKLGGPSALDWRAKGAVTSIKDQGWCGSCWAFAAAAYCESNLIINNGIKNDIDLSEQYLLECTPESDCKGGFPAQALLQVVTKGIPKQQVFSYNPAVTHQNICQTRKGLKVKGKQVYVYFSLSDHQMIYLLQTSPVIVGVASQDWQFYKGGIMKCKPNGTEDHAVLLVGYTTDYWIVKNQWGSDWGENGFIRISRNRDSNCLLGVEVDTLLQKGVKLIWMMMLMIIYVTY